MFVSHAYEIVRRAARRSPTEENFSRETLERTVLALAVTVNSQGRRIDTLEQEREQRRRRDAEWDNRPA